MHGKGVLKDILIAILTLSLFIYLFIHSFIHLFIFSVECEESLSSNKKNQISLEPGLFFSFSRPFLLTLNFSET
jgi:hypothetical protein